MTSTTSAPRGLTFQVDAVERAAFKPSDLDAAAVGRHLLDRGEQLEYLYVQPDTADQQVAPSWHRTRGHAFFHASLTAFAAHFGLVLSADMLYQVILEGLNAHVAQHAEELRARFVTHDGKQHIQLQRDGFVLGGNNDWAGLIDEFTSEIRRLAQPSAYQDIVGQPFSTTMPADLVCRQVALMSTMKHYFSYGFSTLCGYPTVTLLGTRADYVLLQDQVHRLAEYMMPEFAKTWLPALDSVLSQFVSAWDGAIDTHFWGSFCKYDSTHGSGASTFISGWINVLFPFIGEEDHANPYCLPWVELAKKVEEETEASKDNHWSKPGNDVSYYARRFCTANVDWNYLGTKVPLVFKAGFVGYTIDPATSDLTPRMTWGIVHPKKEGGGEESDE